MAKKENMGLLGRSLSYLEGVRSEAKKVVWPSRAETIATTGAVFVMVIVSAVFLFGADQVLAWIVRGIMSLGM